MSDEFDSFVSEMAEAVLSDDQPGEVNAKPTTPISATDEGGASDDDELDFGDMPNGKIRYEKLRKQRAERDARIAELERQIAERDGKLSILEKPNTSEPEEDPTEFMDEQGKFLFNQNRQLIDAVKTLADELASIKKNGEVEKLSKKEEAFFQQNQELLERRDEIVEETREFIKTRPELKAMLRKGTLSFKGLYKLVQAESDSEGPPASRKTQDPEAVFSGTPKSPAPSKVKPGLDSWKKGVEVLTNRNSENKGEAVDAMLDAFADDIIKLL